MKKNQKVKLAIILIVTVLSIGCDDENSIDKKQQALEYLSEETNLDEEKIEKIIEEELKKQQEEETIQYFEEKMEIASESEAEEEITEILTESVEFIFEGSEVNGVTFDDLTKEAKEEIVKNIEVTNRILEHSKISEKTKTAFEELTKKSKDIIEIIIDENVSLETQTKIEETADEVIGKVKKRTFNTYNKIKEYLNQ